MLTDYLVSCPHFGCNWRGSLLPEGNQEAWRTAVPRVREVVFCCPRCGGTWHAEIMGDDVRPLPVTDSAMPTA